MPNQLASIMLGTADPDRLRDWYRRAFAPKEDEYGWMDFGGCGLLIDGRDDVPAHNDHPGRVILNFHVDDARAVVEHLDRMGVTWVVRLDRRDHGVFSTLRDPDGNYLQVIEFDK
ncbi:VOC family protein [Amycolatopsis suaedae]|uniref:VOC family protein n=1 Tax=Amycolatopsis suaedae TaxID=2510978 RepID=A0A4Q7JFL9_9PSEU|nr:VOC family protein [Amycolatopsis suaedae]RZQ66012.1 VOC family protein [Amycolatopsis suaedae]